jgi:hypothetical protein
MERLVPISSKVPKKTKTAFFDYCRAKKETPSTALRRLIERELAP